MVPRRLAPGEVKLPPDKKKGCPYYVADVQHETSNFHGQSCFTRQNALSEGQIKSHNIPRRNHTVPDTLENRYLMYVSQTPVAYAGVNQFQASDQIFRTEGALTTCRQDRGKPDQVALGLGYGRVEGHGSNVNRPWAFFPLLFLTTISSRFIKAATPGAKFGAESGNSKPRRYSAAFNSAMRLGPPGAITRASRHAAALYIVVLVVDGDGLFRPDAERRQ